MNLDNPEHRLPGEGPGSISPWHEPTRMRNSLPTHEKFELGERWAPAFAGKATKSMRQFRFFHPREGGGPGAIVVDTPPWIPAFAVMTD